VVKRRFVTYPELVKGDRLFLPEEEAHHAIRVLRLKPGDAVSVIDGIRVYEGKIESISKKEVSVKIETRREAVRKRPEIILYQAFVKGKKAEFIVEKTTEAGVDEIVFFSADHSVAVFDERKISRLSKIALQASKQSGREYAPVVRRLERFEFPVLDRGEIGFFLDPKGETLTPAGVDSGRELKRVYVFVGPEGGFSAQEKEAALKMGISVIRLNYPVLRTETAALAAVLITSFLYRSAYRNSHVCR